MLKKKRSSICKPIKKKGKKHKRNIQYLKIVIFKKKYYNNGKRGIRGAQGLRGKQGPSGAHGSPGPRGIRGIQGPPGPPGTVIVPNIIILPDVQRFFYSIASDTQSLASISANEFTDDEGSSISSFTTPGNNGYVNLHINGILQEGRSYRLDPNALIINLDNQTIFAGTPIILEFVTFSARIIY